MGEGEEKYGRRGWEILSRELSWKQVAGIFDRVDALDSVDYTASAGGSA